MRSFNKLMVGGLVATALTGCGNMSGLDAKDSFACKAPDGVLCESMSGIYANAQAQNLPGQRVNRKGGSEVSRAKVEPQGVMTRPITSGTPIRSAPVILRVWFAPWEDNDGDLHDQSYVYLPVDNGKWLVEHNRRRIQDTYKPVRAPAVAATQPSATALRQQPMTAEPGGVDGGVPTESPSIVDAPVSQQTDPPPVMVESSPAQQVGVPAMIPMPSYSSPSALSPSKLEEARRATDELTRRVLRGMPQQ